MAGRGHLPFPVSFLLCFALLLPGLLHADEAAPTPAVPLQRLALGEAGSLPWTFAGPAEAVRVSSLLIVVHGHPRDLSRSLAAGLDAVRQAAHGADTVVVAPLFPVPAEAAHACSGRDTPPAAAGDAQWSCAGWIDGALTLDGRIAAFAAMDRLLAELVRRWPDVRRVTLAGFSAGAQFVQHYAAFARPPAGPALRYLVADPGSWLYFDSLRPWPRHGNSPVAWSDCVTATGEGACAFVWQPAPTDCASATRWKYGMEALPEHLRARAEGARERYAAADIAYLEGALDSGSGPGRYERILDKSCAAMAQGPYRLQRGLAYAAYEREILRPARPRAFAVVPGCAHDVACVLPSLAARPLLFPDEAAGS